MATNFNWKGDWYKDRIKQAIFKSVYAGAVVISTKIKTLLNQKASNRSNPTGSPSAPGQPPARASGNLALSIQIAADTNQPVVKIGTASKYARIHEFGGIITPKRSKYLTIPVSKQARRASDEGQTAKEAFGTKVQWVRARGGNGLLVESRGKGKRAKTIVHYVLKKSIKMPKRPFFMPGFIQAKGDSIQKMREVIQREMGRL